VSYLFARFNVDVFLAAAFNNHLSRKWENLESWQTRHERDQPFLVPVRKKFRPGPGGKKF
jgi:hypothetical protein